ncbi:hypothetical protein Tco_1541699 [Tanacetum coccineum]
MCTYPKNMEGYKLNDLKLKDFDSIQEMFDRAFKRVNTFEYFRIEMVEGKEKRARTELIQEITKKQKVEDDKEIAKLKQCLEIIPNEEEVTTDAVPLAVNQMPKSFDWGDLEDLYKLVKAKYKSTRPVEDLDLLLWGNLKTMFEPHVEDAVWRNQQGYKVLEWKLYDSCGVHSLMMQYVHIYMLVEKKYPFALLTLSMMLEKKLKIDYESEIAYQLLKFIIKQLKKIKSLLDAVRITAAQVYVNIALMKRRIIVVTRHKIMKMYDYDHLEQIEVRRDDQKLYTFKEVQEEEIDAFEMNSTSSVMAHLRCTAALSEEVDAESRNVRWWKDIRERSQAFGNIGVIDKILEEDFDALLGEGSEILHSIEGTILEEKLFAEFNEFMAMTADENSESRSDTKEPPFEKITFNTD